MERDGTDQGILITGARVYTADRHHPWAEAVLTRGKRIAYVGSEQDAREQAGDGVEEIHVPGGLVTPGLNDSHVHMTMGAYNLTTLNLEGVTTLPDLQERLRAYAAEHPEREWIEAYGLAYEPLTGLDRPEREVLDAAIPDRPLFVRAFDSHSSWCNSEGLRRAGIERGADIPLPNEVVVDAEGNATGMLKERLAYNLVQDAIGHPSPQRRDAMLCDAMRFVNRLGITSVQNMDADLDRLQQYQRLLERGDLTIRAHHYMSVWEGTPPEYLDEVVAFAQQYSGPFNRTIGIKMFIDGVVESKTAMMLEPYADGSGDVGVPDMDPAVHRSFVHGAHVRGLDVTTHAIGDRGVRTVLDNYESAHQEFGRGERRHRIEHIEVHHPDDLPRFARLGVTASMQPLHAAPTTDPRYTPWTQLVGPEREPYAFNWRSILETGAHLSFGSDWPIVTPDVRIGLHTALTRTNPEGEPDGGWQPQQAVTLAQGLDAYTRGAAYAERQERVKGTLGAGKLADITVFARDLFALAPRELPQTGIAATIVDGRIVYRSQ
ncbi:MAG TPA: amidohydrolase [Chloroflexota bacterium]|nr:amidohydrolase [Chloroflexota bacterium]